MLMWAMLVRRVFAKPSIAMYNVSLVRLVTWVFLNVIAVLRMYYITAFKDKQY